MIESLHRVVKTAQRPVLRAFTAVTFLLIAACGVSDAFTEGFDQGMIQEATAALDSADQLLAAAQPSPERDEFVAISQTLRAGLDDGSLNSTAVTFSAGMIEGAAQDGALDAGELQACRSNLPEGTVLPPR